MKLLLQIIVLGLSIGTSVYAMERWHVHESGIIEENDIIKKECHTLRCYADRKGKQISLFKLTNKTTNSVTWEVITKSLFLHSNGWEPFYSGENYTIDESAATSYLELVKER